MRDGESARLDSQVEYSDCRNAKEDGGGSEIAPEQIEAFMSALRDVLNKVPSHFWQNRGISFQNVYADRDAEDLVSWLKRAIDAKH